MDRGSQHHYIRDYGRVVTQHFMLAILVLLVVAGYSRAWPVRRVGAAIYYSPVYAMYALMILWVVDYFILWRSLKKRLIARDSAVQRGSGVCV